MDAVHEHDGIVPVKTPVKPFVHFLADVIDHPGDAQLAIVLSVDLVEHLAYLTLRQILRVEASGQLLTLLFLVPKPGLAALVVGILVSLVQGNSTISSRNWLAVNLQFAALAKSICR